MISVEKARGILAERGVIPAVETVPLPDSLQRILAQDVVSAVNLPPFKKSAMDGFALSKNDGSTRFKIVETIAAGSIPRQSIKRGECAKIMTGAMLPEGADRVIKKEVTREQDGIMVVVGSDKKANVCEIGEDVRVGEVVLRQGTPIRPAELGIMASLGIEQVNVFQRISVGLVVTGSEIIEPGRPLKQGQIYNSNAYSLGAQISQTGALVHYAGIASDDYPKTRQMIGELLDQKDMVLVTGGVSVGDFDFVPRVLIDLGVDIHFEKVAVKPGKPTLFGTRDEKVVFGLPGNPVSTFVIFEIFVKPLLYRLMGCDFEPVYISGVLEKEIRRKSARRTAFIPVVYHRGRIRPVDYHGSAHFSALSATNALLMIEAGVDRVEQGHTVHVRQI